MATKKYVPNQKISRKSQKVAISQLPSGEWANLWGEDLEMEVEGTADKPPHTRRVRGATDKELEFLYHYERENGVRNPRIVISKMWEYEQKMERFVSEQEE